MRNGREKDQMGSVTYIHIYIYIYGPIVSFVIMKQYQQERRRRGQQRMRWLNSIIDSLDMSLSKLQEIVKDGKPGVLQSMGLQSWTQLSN